eukprot:s9079_g2.t1
MRKLCLARPGEVDSDEDAQLRRSRDRGTFCLAILSFVVALISLIVTVMPASKENICDAYLTSLAKDMMLPHHYDLPQLYVNRTVLSMELAELVEQSRAPRSQVRLIVVLGRRQVGKTSVVREQFMNKTNVYYHALEARAMQLGWDLDHACGSQHLHKGHIQHIVGKVYEKSRQNMTVIFDIPHNAEDADVTRVYEDWKGMVYDDAHRRPVLGIIILSNHYQVDAFPRDKGRFRTLWVGNLEESEATEYVGKLHADGSVLKDVGTGLRELAWANDLPRWKEEVEYSVRHARASRHARKLMAMISEGGAAGLSMTRLLTLEDSLSFPLEDVFRIVRPFSEVFYFDSKRDAFLFVSPHHRVCGRSTRGGDGGACNDVGLMTSKIEASDAAPKCYSCLSAEERDKAPAGGLMAIEGYGRLQAELAQPGHDTRHMQPCLVKVA